MFGISAIRLGLIAAAVVAALAIIATWRHGIYREGVEDTLITVREQNDNAAREAGKVKASVDSCFDSGGAWNVSTGTCNYGP